MSNVVNVSEILDIINSILETSEITQNDINEDLSMLGINSIMFISIIIAIEEKYNIEIPDEYLLTAGIGTVNMIIDIVTTVIEGKLYHIGYEAGEKWGNLKWILDMMK